MNWLKFTAVIILAGCILSFSIDDANAFQMESRYCTITYSSNDNLRKFNNDLYMGRLRSQIKNNGDTIQDEVAAKINFIVEKVMTVLDMFPPEMKFSIVIEPTEKEVQQDFFRLYNVKVDYIGFYSPSKNIVFYSADNIDLRIVAHEIGHVVVKHYFKVPPPQRIHELLAEFAAKHVTD